MAELQEGTVLDDLRIDGVLGRGGMGVVYRAFDMRLERPVALKVIADQHAADATFRRLFLREARTAAGLAHPHVVTVHRYDERDGLVFLVTQLIEGTDLKELIASSGRLDPRLATTVVGQVASALDAAHERGLVHRDVKPANVLVGGLPRRPHAYLSDFGLTRAISRTTQHSSTAMWGTPAYMAPELFDGGPPGVASDVYALGRTLYQALAGALPRPAAPIGAPGATLVAVLADPEQGRALDEVVRRATADEPGERHRTAGELAAAATAALRSGGGSGARPRVPVPTGTPTIPPGAPSGPPAPRTAGPTYLPPDPAPGPAVPAPTFLPPDPAPRPAASTSGPPSGAPTFVPSAAPPGPVAPAWPRYAAPDPDPAVPAAPQPAVPARRTRRWPIVALVAAVAGAAAFVLGPDRSADVTRTPVVVDTVTLDPVADHGDTTTLTWTGPTGLDYAVEVTPAGAQTSTLLAGRVTTLTVAVISGVPYCFRVTATDASKVLTSNVQPVRGASC